MFFVYAIMEAVVLFGSSIFIWYLYKNNKYQNNRVSSADEQSVNKPDSRNPETDYKKEMVLFNKLFLLEKEAEARNNLNIDPDLYRDKNNHDPIVENAWKSRILFQNTVQGNVIMYYDIYKLAFVYYSDMQVSYKWLNYCAMKYVRMFFCRDFFVDDSFLPAKFVNPFNQHKIDCEKKELEKKEKKRGLMSIDFKSDVFLKKKKTDVATTVIVKDVVEVVVVEKFVNNFRYMGKLVNFSFLKIPEKQEKICENYQYIDFKLKQEQNKKKSKSSQSVNSLYGWI